MTTKIKWRLTKLPDPSEVSLLIEKDILTKDEAREILFSLETQEDRDKQSLENEIKFLRDLVSQLAHTRSALVETIRYVEKPYNSQPWFNGYNTYVNAQTAMTGLNSAQTLTTTGTANITNALYTATSGSGSIMSFNTDSPDDFTEIKTF